MQIAEQCISEHVSPVKRFCTLLFRQQNGLTPTQPLVQRVLEVKSLEAYSSPAPPTGVKHNVLKADAL